jgi:hypothetical protein
MDPSPNTRMQGESQPDSPSDSGLGDAEPVQASRGGAIVQRVREWIKAHSRLLWWVHSFYALAVGLGVLLFAGQGFEHARVLSVSVAAAWLLVVLFFRFRTPHSVVSPKPQGLAFFAVTYVLKNLYQGMLFFLLPFYFKSATGDSANFVIVCVLGAFALLSTLDVVFDRVLMRFPILGSLFHGFTLFACLNLVVPALLPDTRTLTSECVAGALAVLSFITIHVRRSWTNKPAFFVAVPVAMALGAFGVYQVRGFLPPVPMHLSHAAVGPSVREDGALTMEVTALDARSLQRMVAVTDVVLPAGKGDRFVHVWRLNDHVVQTVDELSRVPGAQGGVRLRSMLYNIPKAKSSNGKWSVDVETADGQLIGRTRFDVIP